MQLLICDSCDQPITDMSDRVEVLIFTHEPIADPRLELCAACGADVINSVKVQRGQRNVMERITASIEQFERVEHPVFEPPEEVVVDAGA